MRNMKTKLTFVVALAVPFAYGITIYENDFSTRTSAAAIRSAEWKSVDYVSGDLLTNTNNVNPWAFPSGSSQKVQDGWIKSQEVANIGNARVYSDDGNDMATLGDASNGTSEKNRKICIVKQRLGATFTNGTVTVQFDFLPPAAWTSYDGVLRRAVFSVGDERFYSPDVNNDKVYRYTAGSVGVALTNFSASGSTNTRYVYWNSDVDSANTAPSSQEVTKGAWHRVLMAINLDARTWGFTMYEMGNHPAFDAATPTTPVHSESNLPFADSTVTSVSSICLNGYGVAWGSNSYSNAGGDPRRCSTRTSSQRARSILKTGTSRGLPVPCVRIPKGRTAGLTSPPARRPPSSRTTRIRRWCSIARPTAHPAILPCTISDRRFVVAW